MITGHVFIATSLDGFIARENGDIDWLLARDQAGEDHGYDDFIRDIDVIVMGRGTYQSVLGMGEWFYNRPVLVLSSQLAGEDIPVHLRDRVRVANKTPEQAMAMVQAEGARRVYVDGGSLIQSFLACDLISDLVLTRVPVLLGSGRPLFGGKARDISLRHAGTRSFPSGLVQSRYEVAR